MEIKQNDNYFELTLDNINFIIDPVKFNFENPIILTDPKKNLNRNKIFNSAGEYNIGNVYFWGFDNKDSLSYLFYFEEGNLLLSVSVLIDDVFKKIKLLAKEIKALFFINHFDDKLVSFFKPSLVIGNRDFNLARFDKQKGRKLKLNLKKVNNLIFVFEK